MKKSPKIIDDFFDEPVEVYFLMPKLNKIMAINIKIKVPSGDNIKKILFDSPVKYIRG